MGGILDKICLIARSALRCGRREDILTDIRLCQRHWMLLSGFGTEINQLWLYAVCFAFIFYC